MHHRLSRGVVGEISGGIYGHHILLSAIITLNARIYVLVHFTYITTLTLLYTLRLQGERLYPLAPLNLPLIRFKSINSANSRKLKSL